MARFGGMTALRAALGAVGGITEGLQQRELLAREKAKQDALMARQAGLDAAAIRNEQRQAIGMGMVSADQYNPRGIAGGMDMPGATPRSPIFRQTIGGTDFVLPEAPSATKHRESIFKTQGEMAKAREAATARAERDAMLEAGRDRRASSRRSGKAEPDEEEMRREGRQYIAAQARNPALMRALTTAFADDPASAADPGMVAYRIKKSRTVPNASATGGYTPKASAKGDDLSVETLLREIEKPTTTPAPGTTKPSGKATIPAVLAPAATPASSGSMADAAWKQAQRAERWDQIKTASPNMPDEQITAQVMREIP